MFDKSVQAICTQSNLMADELENVQQINKAATTYTADLQVSHDIPSREWHRNTCAYKCDYLAFVGRQRHGCALR
jgi:hypothetical protein